MYPRGGIFWQRRKYLSVVEVCLVFLEQEEPCGLPAVVVVLAVGQVGLHQAVVHLVGAIAR